MQSFIEVTIVVDSSDALAVPRKGGIGVNTIASFIDVSGEKFAGNAKVKLTLTEPADYLTDEGKEVVHCQRTLYVQEDYATVRIMMEAALLSDK